MEREKTPNILGLKKIWLYYKLSIKMDAKKDNELGP